MKTYDCIKVLILIDNILFRFIKDSDAKKESFDYYNKTNENFIKNYWILKSLLKIKAGICNKFGFILIAQKYDPETYGTSQITDDEILDILKNEPDVTFAEHVDLELYEFCRIVSREAAPSPKCYATCICTNFFYFPD